MTANSPEPSDLARATAAGIYDAVLGGVDHTDAEQLAADRLTAVDPVVPGMAWANRGFLQRTARWLARRGIRRFLDIGAGLPTMNNTHQVVHSIDPAARVVYVDNDPVTVARATEMLNGVANVTYLQHDLVAEDLLAHPAVADLVGGDEPVGLLAIGVLYFVPDENDPVGRIRRIVHALPRGSYIAISHVISDRQDERLIRAGADIYRATSTVNLYVRPSSQVAEFLRGLQIVPPYEGAAPRLSPIGLWGAEDPVDAHDEASSWFVGAVARKA